MVLWWACDPYKLFKRFDDREINNKRTGFHEISVQDEFRKYGDMVMWWSGNISVLLGLCEGNPQVTGGFLSQSSVTRSSDVFFVVSEETVKQTVEVTVIWDAIISMWRHCNDNCHYNVPRTIFTQYSSRNTHLTNFMLERSWGRNRLFLCYCRAYLIMVMTPNAIAGMTLN